VAVEDNGRTGTTEPGAAATFMSFEYMSLKVWLCTQQEIACQKKQGQVADDTAACRSAAGTTGTRGGRSLAVEGFTVMACVGVCEIEAKWCIVRDSFG
jgi:hypothetical protein